MTSEMHSRETYTGMPRGRGRECSGLGGRAATLAAQANARCVSSQMTVVARASTGMSSTMRGQPPLSPDRVEQSARPGPPAPAKAPICYNSGPKPNTRVAVARTPTSHIIINPYDHST